MEQNQLDKIESILTLVTKVASGIKLLASLSIAGVLFVARVEWNHADHEKRLLSVEEDGKRVMQDVARIKGSLGVAQVRDAAADKVVWTEETKTN